MKNELTMFDLYNLILDPTHARIEEQHLDQQITKFNSYPTI